MFRLAFDDMLFVKITGYAEKGIASAEGLVRNIFTGSSLLNRLTPSMENL